MKPDKSDHIRRLLDEQPSLTPREIQAELASQGVEVTRNLCKVVRHRELRKKAAPDKSARVAKKAGLRSDEREPTGRINRTRAFRITKRDMKIWRRMKAETDSLDDPSEELHKFDGQNLVTIPEVQRWIESAQTWRTKHRRRDICNQFIQDLMRLYPPPRETDPMEQLRNEKLPFPPKRIVEQQDSTKKPLSKNRRARHLRLQVEANELRKTHDRVDSIVSQHDRMLDVFLAADNVEYLLSCDAWHRWESLKAIANSYSVVSALNDLLALPWEQSMLPELPDVLSEVFLYEPGEADGPWMKRSDLPQLLFLLALWCVDRIRISKLDENGQRRLTIGKTARL